MSYLLNALRKTEDLKKRGPAPSIYSTQGPDRPPAGSRRLGMTLILVLPAVFVLAWYGWTHWQAGAEAVPSVGSADSSVLRDPGIPSGRPVQDSPVANGQDARNAVTPPVRLTSQRTPVENLAPDSAQEAEPDTVSLPTPASGERSSQGRAEPVPEAALPIPGPVEDRGGAPPAQADSGEQDVTEEFDPGLPGLIHVWELPENIRSGLMEMNISVLVYAERPEDRFILMNGKRWVEGDEPQKGLVIEEIQRAGVVLSYRVYRFLVSR